MNASDVMVTNVITAKADAPVREVAQLLLDNRIRGAPVVGHAGMLYTPLHYQ